MNKTKSKKEPKSGVNQPYQFKPRDPGVIELCGDPLPWVPGGIHLGNNISTKMEGMRQDIKIKRAAFIQKNIDLNQEFQVCHPSTKVKMNRIYNFHFTGSPLWDLFSREAIMLENSWNTAVRIMFDLPMQTHKYLIEPISQAKHLKNVLIERFLSFLSQIEKSKKLIPKQLLSFIKHDVRSTTGSNLRNILLLTKKNTIEEITLEDIKLIKYNQIDNNDMWKVGFINEVTEIKFNQSSVHYQQRCFFSLSSLSRCYFSPRRIYRRVPK